ncbi:MAG TPA: hypothetical protein VNS63_01915 [Blastocatellia bacterium]|nr:hypothetical protein [Blastocatellia bacterium]
MLNQQENYNKSETQPRIPHIDYRRRAISGGGLLGNGELQSVSSGKSARATIDRIRASNEAPLTRVVKEDATPMSKLEILKRERFRPEGKAERIARSLAALNQPEPIELSLEEWQLVTEDPDLLDL